MSLVLDRILLCIFFLAITLSSLVILTSSPHLFTESNPVSGKRLPTYAELANDLEQQKPEKPPAH